MSVSADATRLKGQVVIVTRRDSEIITGKLDDFFESPYRDEKWIEKWLIVLRNKTNTRTLDIKDVLRIRKPDLSPGK